MNSARKKNQATIERSRSNRNSVSKYIEQILSQFSRALISFRAKESLQQSQLAEKLDLGIARYNQYENLRDLNFDSGPPLGMLVRFAQLEGLPLSELIARFESSEKAESTDRQELESKLAKQFTRLSQESTEEFLRRISSESEKTKIKEDALVWWVKTGIDMLRLPRAKQLEIEIEIQKSLIESSDQVQAKLRRERIFTLMSELLASK